jgi:hypothetical protein
MRGWMIVAVVAVATLVLAVLGIRAMLGGRRVPTKAKVLIAGAVLWLLSPLDPLPEALFGPVGMLDDVAVLIALLRYVLDTVQPGVPDEPVTPVEQRVQRRRMIDASNWWLSDGRPDRP